MNRFSRIINVFGMFAAGTLFSQPSGKSLDIYNLINEARSNPKAFAERHSIEINKIQPKFTIMLKEANPMGKIIWDENLAINCKEKVNGNLNPSYRGSNKMCGTSSGNGSGYYENSPIHFICAFYTHVIDEDDLYFGFYINSLGHAYSWGKTCQPSQKYKFEAPRTIDSSMVDFIKINTASNEMYLSQMDKEIIKELNFVRQYPKVYALIVANHLASQSYSWIGITKDEYMAGKELIDELNAMQPCSLLFPNKCLYESAKKHGRDCENRGFTGHTGSDGSSPFERISNFCSGISGNENIVGGAKNARNLVISLLVDSGISSRGHRYNMLNADWNYVGCYGYKTSKMYICIQNFASNKLK